MQKEVFDFSSLSGFVQKMTYCDILTIGHADRLVMKKKSVNRRLPKPISIVEIFWIVFSIFITCILFVDLATTINHF